MNNQQYTVINNYWRGSRAIWFFLRSSEKHSKSLLILLLLFELEGNISALEKITQMYQNHKTTTECSAHLLIYKVLIVENIDLKIAYSWTDFHIQMFDVIWDITQNMSFVNQQGNYFMRRDKPHFLWGMLTAMAEKPLTTFKKTKSTL